MFGRNAYLNEQDNAELVDFKTKGCLDKWLIGFKFEITSAFYYFEKELYKSAIIETVLFFLLLVPYIIVTFMGAIFLSLVSLWRYFGAFGGILILVSFILLFVLIVVSPLMTDVYHRTSEKTERLLAGENVNPQSGPRCTGGCITFVLVYFVTGCLEFIILFPVGVFCTLSLIIPPVGIVLLLIFTAFCRSWGSFKVVFIRHGNYLGLFTFFFHPEVFPFAMGIGTGYMCMKRVLRQFPGGSMLSHYVTVVSATRFYYYWYEQKGIIPNQQLGGHNAAFMQQNQSMPAQHIPVQENQYIQNFTNMPPVQPTHHIAPIQQAVQQPQIYADDNMKGEF